MKFYLSVALIFSLLLAFSSCTSRKEAKIHYSLKEDGRNWKISTEKTQGNMTIIEYTVDDESIDNWKELFTLHYIRDLSFPPHEYYQMFLDELKKHAPQNKISNRIIEETPDSLLGEWWIEDHSPNDQHEWIKIFDNGKGIAIIRYTTKDNQNFEERKKTWEKILKDSSYS